MEKTSYQEKEVSTSNTKRGQYSPRRKDTAPKVNPQLAVELIFQEIKRIEAFTKRIEDATQRKVQIDEKSLENAYKSFVEQITTISQSQQSYPEVFRMLNRTRIELDSLESSSLYELEKK